MSAANGNDVDSPAARPPASAAIDLRREFVDNLTDLYGGGEDFDLDVLQVVFAVGDHLARYLPDVELQRVGDVLNASPPSTVRLVLRLARDIAEEAGVDLPRLDLPPLASSGKRSS